VTEVTAFCVGGGLLARASVPVSKDPTVFAAPSITTPTPCNNLRCLTCGVTVRHGVGVFPTAAARERAAELYALDDWSEVPWLTEGPNGLEEHGYDCRRQQAQGCSTRSAMRG
jgi:hypothetical protein